MTKTCSICKLDKEVTEFLRPHGRKFREMKSCNSCGKTLTRASRKASLHKYNKKGKSREWKLKSWYGLTVEQYQAMVDKQEGKCAICKTVPPYQLAVDHCHETNTIRGLLCRPCNLGIGSFKHDPEITEAAVRYLRRTMP